MSERRGGPDEPSYLAEYVGLGSMTILVLGQWLRVLGGADLGATGVALVVGAVLLAAFNLVRIVRGKGARRDDGSPGPIR